MCFDEGFEGGNVEVDYRDAVVYENKILFYLLLLRSAPVPRHHKRLITRYRTKINKKTNHTFLSRADRVKQRNTSMF